MPGFPPTLSKKQHHLSLFLSIPHSLCACVPHKAIDLLAVALLNISFPLTLMQMCLNPVYSLLILSHTLFIQTGRPSCGVNPCQ